MAMFSAVVRHAGCCVAFTVDSGIPVLGFPTIDRTYPVGTSRCTWGARGFASIVTLGLSVSCVYSDFNVQQGNAGTGGVSGPIAGGSGVGGTDGGFVSGGTTAESGGTSALPTGGKSAVAGGPAGGVVGSGGSLPATGGSSGLSSSGGTTADSGGASTASTGGKSAASTPTGGITGAGGSLPATGGSGGAASGGATTGGAATGGSMATGGAATGGSMATGGAASGGSMATGGSAPACAGATSSAAGDCVSQVCSGLGTPLLTASTIDQPNSFTLTCGAGNSSDIGVFWTAPASGWYRFTTDNSSFDTVLALFKPTCSDRNELGCNNNVGSSPASKVVQEFARNDSALVVIDGNSGDRGTAVLNVDLVTCPSSDLTQQPMPATLTTVGGTNNHSGACGGNGVPERSYVWVPQSDGLYKFSASSGSMQPSLYVEQGPECGGELLGCNAASSGAQATVTRWLPRGKPVTVIADSSSGSGLFTLDIEPSSSACPMFNSVSPDTTYLLEYTDPDVLSPSCVQSTASGAIFAPRSEQTYHVDLRQYLAADILVEGDANFALYALSGSKCDGAEVGCELASANGNGKYSAMLELSSGDYVIVVELLGNAQVNYTVMVLPLVL